MRQCVKCHRYVTSPPRPDLDHQAGAPGKNCLLPHHPSPCSYIDQKTGNPCDYIYPDTLQQEQQEQDVISSPDAASLQQQIHNLRQERAEQQHQLQLLQTTNRNLQQTQNHLLSQNFAAPSSSFSTLTTNTITSTSPTPSMGTGFSQSFSTTPSLLPQSLMSAASSLISSNAPPASVPHSIPGYTGPTIPQLRSDPGTNQMANQLFSVLMREIPALNAPPSSIPQQPLVSLNSVPVSVFMAWVGP